MGSVSVFVPCYKYAHFLKQCVESVLTQERVDVEVLILDDASPDHTPDVAAELMAHDTRVKYRRHAVNLGHIATYNEGLDWASRDYTVLLSADDFLTPRALYRAVELMDAHPNVGMTYGREIVYPSNAFEPNELSQTLRSSDGFDYKILNSTEFLHRFCSTGQNQVSAPTAVVRTALQKQLGGYRKELPHAGDMEMWMRFAAHAPVGYIDECQAYYRWHGNNMQCSYIYPGIADLEQRRAAFQLLFRDQGEWIEDRARLQALANRSVAEAMIWLAHKMIEAGDSDSAEKCRISALNTLPQIRTMRGYRGLRLKQLIGAKAWSFLGPLSRRIRATPAKAVTA